MPTRSTRRAKRGSVRTVSNRGSTLIQSAPGSRWETARSSRSKPPSLSPRAKWTKASESGAASDSGRDSRSSSSAARLAPASRLGENPGAFGLNAERGLPGGRRGELGQGLVRHPLGCVHARELNPEPARVLAQGQRLVERLQRVLLATHVIEHGRQCRTPRVEQRVQHAAALHFAKGLVEAAARREIPPVLFVGVRVVRVEIQRAMEGRVGRGEVPLVGELQLAQRVVRRRDGVVELERLERCGTSLGVGLERAELPEVQVQAPVRLRDAGIRVGVGRVQRDGLFEVPDRLLRPFDGRRFGGGPATQILVTCLIVAGAVGRRQLLLVLR